MNTSYDYLTVNTEQAKRLTVNALATRQRVMLWGSYGIGKTSIVREIGRAMKYESVIVLTPSTDDVIDYKLPYLQDGESGEKISAFAYSDRLPRTGRHLIFVDEINTAPTSLQPTLYSLILDGKIGGYSLPPECDRIAAGNREHDKCAAQTMSAALKSRLGLHLNVIPDVDDWTKWATGAGIMPEIVGFVRNVPDALVGQSPDDPTGGCTPRGLECLSRLLSSGRLDGVLLSKAVCGVIGQAYGNQLVAFIELYRNSIDLDAILKSPKSVDVPDEAQLLFAVSAGLAARATEETLPAIAEYARRMPACYRVFTFNDLARRNKDLQKTKSYAEFIVENQSLFI